MGLCGWRMRRGRSKTNGCSAQLPSEQHSVLLVSVLWNMCFGDLAGLGLEGEVLPLARGGFVMGMEVSAAPLRCSITVHPSLASGSCWQR